MIIRKAKTDDLIALIHLYYQLLPNDNINTVAGKCILQKMLNDNNYSVLVIEENKDIISTCTLVLVYNITHGSKPFGIIENVITDEQYRGKGYGKSIINEAIRIAKINQCHKIMVQTRRKEEYVTDFYKKCGFSTTISKGLMIDLEV